MNKQEYILKVLDALQDTRPLAPGLRLLVTNHVFNDQTLDALIEIFRAAIDTVYDQDQKEALQKSLDIAHKIKQVEQEALQQDTQDLADLENMFKDL